MHNGEASRNGIEVGGYAVLFNYLASVTNFISTHLTIESYRTIS